MTPKQSELAQEHLFAISDPKSRLSAETALHIFQLKTTDQRYRQVLIGLTNTDPEFVLHNIIDLQPNFNWEVYDVNAQGGDLRQEYSFPIEDLNMPKARIIRVQEAAKDDDYSEMAKIIAFFQSLEVSEPTIILAQESIAHGLGQFLTGAYSAIV